MVERVWIKEVGVVPAARPLWIALHRANPLAEALDPVRLDPPPSWERLLVVLRFPPLARIAAGRVLEIGTSVAGNALAAALFSYAASRDPASTRPPTPPAVAFGVRFLAHTLWLHQLFQGTPDEATAGWDLAALVAAALEVEPALVHPRDLGPADPLAHRFVDRMRALGAAVRAQVPERWQAAIALCRFAVSHPKPRSLPAPA
jgi:hypothetical protein